MKDFRKSLYIFLCSLLGVLMFMLLERLAVFFYLYLLAGGYLVTNMSYLQIAIFDYIVLVLAMMLGAWYGVWLGLYWYRIIYEEQSHPGLVGHVSEHYFPRPSFARSEGVAELKKRLVEDLSRLETVEVATVPSPLEPVPVKRKIVRRSAPKKLKTAGASSAKILRDSQPQQ
ncbi:MAG: hypothetical protein P4L74_06215 [Candidatus Doudnabacteria bacterium]|nr:hypothetical protein [Candidatus Doudnabacteria bacterium]